MVVSREEVDLYLARGDLYRQRIVSPAFSWYNQATVTGIWPLAGSGKRAVDDL
ncbi:MAG TPA: hypothetical protein VLY63_22730 [Anaerolineae bacterium]|nr:hypothetical protein [Anaerolineae bacterium]